MHWNKARSSILIISLLLFTVCPVAAQGEKEAVDGMLLPQIFSDLQELSVAYLRPGQIKERLARTPVIYIPLGPVEWHGLHLPFGTDPLNAQTVSLAACRLTGGVVWPALFFGSASLRTPEQARSLFGFTKCGYTWSVDFPSNILPSAYSPPDMFAQIVRETVRTASLIGPRLVLLVSGHAAGDHMAALERVVLELNALGGSPLVHVRGAWEKKPLYPEIATGHACADETSIMMAQTRAVDLNQLPPFPTPLRYTETGIVDDWSSSGKTGYIVAESADPRRAASAVYGKAIISHTAEEIAEEVRELLKGLD